MKKKKKGIIITVIVFAALLGTAAVILHFLFLPQVQVVDAMVNTLSTARESGIDRQYGGYDMLSGIIDGNYDFEVNYGDSRLGVRRNKGQQRFLMFADMEISDTLSLDAQFYVDAETSVLAAKDRSIRIDYADHMAETMPDFLKLLSDIAPEDWKTGAGIYVDLMEALSGTAEKDSNVFERLYERTKDVFLGLESERLDKELFTVNGKKVRCQVYQIVFNAKDLAEYIQDCYEISFSTGERINGIVEAVSGYTLDELFEMADNEAEQMQDLYLYFAVNHKGQLVSIYGEDLTEDQLDIELNFLGGDYLCDEVEFHMQDAAGNEITVRKDDISVDGSPAMEYTYTNRTAEGEVQEKSLTYTFEDDTVSVRIDDGEKPVLYSMDITGYEKGRYIELQNETGVVYYFGTEVKDIENPERNENLNLLDMDIISAYSFFSDLLKE